MKRFSWLVFLLPLLFIAWAVAVFLLHPGVPNTHDGENHVARIANFVSALKEGQLPPRFAPHLFQGYGYPVFNYNYPLINILAVPFVAIGLSYPIVFKILVIGLLIFGSVGWWFWLRSLNQNNTSRSMAVLSWLCAPYLLSAWFVRGSIGEIAILAFFPWVGWLATQSRRVPLPLWFQSLLVAGFLLSHNVGVLLLTPVVWLLWFSATYKNTEIKLKENLTHWIILWILSGSLVVWFWLPALMEKGYVILDGAKLTTSTQLHGVSFDQLLWSPIKKGFSFVGSIDSQSFQVGIPLLLAAIASLCISLFSKQRSKFAILSLLLFILSIVLQLSSVSWWWGTVPVLSFVQFPWRFGLVTATVGSLLVGLYWSAFPKWLQATLLVLLVGYGVGAVRMVANADWVQQPDIYYLQFPQTTSTAHENLPKSFTLTTLPSWKPEPIVSSSSAQVVVSQWTGRKHVYDVIVTEETILTEPTIAFPGWQTEIRYLGTSRNLTQNIQYWHGPGYSLKESGGLIAFRLVPGSYTITTEFTQFTLWRLIGNGVSLLGAGLVGILFVHFLLKLRKGDSA